MVVPRYTALLPHWGIGLLLFIGHVCTYAYEMKIVNPDKADGTELLGFEADDSLNGTNSSSLQLSSTFLSEFYNEWTSWSNCSRHCEESRIRRCRVHEKCGQSWLKEKRKCKAKTKGCSNRSFKVLGFRSKDRIMEKILYKVLYGPWSAWGPCTKSCKKRRFRTCDVASICGISYIQEEKPCRPKGNTCQKKYTLNTLVPLQEEIHDEVKDNLHRKDSSGKESFPQSKVLQESSDICGYRPRGKSGKYRIVGGQEAQKNSWPWQVAILTRWKEQFCGGTIVAPQWVLTAAHCVRKKKHKKKVVVRVGEHDIDATDGEIDLYLEQDFPNPKFDYSTITHDIALLKLQKPVGPSKRIGYACLPDENYVVPTGTLCYTIGWGKEKTTHVFGSNVLQEAEVPIVNRHKCQNVFNYKILDTQVCAGYSKGGTDSCAGDSGGPLLCPVRNNNTETRWIVYGVTSYGEGCGQRGKYGIYTKVTKYLKWIKKTIESH
ncbi:hypothetical protein CHS0354_005951 [Potamilus streckersoni]|uniref:Peptidase S1 domain-containing protein n=1 Tax=Potamilus streckersoni TaxID=2493646 RepID=A0AAE0SMT9_9BIVA|nr:hypothetical protein CHS0354_005951 [Potamilus streckersoni]